MGVSENNAWEITGESGINDKDCIVLKFKKKSPFIMNPSEDGYCVSMENILLN